MAGGCVVVVGGTRGLGREVAQSYAGDGRDVVVTGRTRESVEAAAQEIGTRAESGSTSQSRT